MPETTETRARRAAIIDLVRSRHVGTQAELGTLLSSRGYEVTQATLSRDLAKLRARRVSLPDGGTAYEVAGFEAKTGVEETQIAAMTDLITRVVDGAGLVVMHTRPGVASAVAALIDQARLEAVIGTIAGDDTIFVAPARNVTPKQLARSLEKLFRR